MGQNYIREAIDEATLHSGGGRQGKISQGRREMRQKTREAVDIPPASLSGSRRGHYVTYFFEME